MTDLAVARSEEIRAFREDGAVVVRDFLDAHWLGVLEQAFDDAFAELAEADAPHYRESNQGRSRFKEGSWFDSAAMREFLRGSPVAELAAAGTGSAAIRYYEDLLIYREAGSTQPTVWHQDTPHWPVTGQQLASIWISLDDETMETGAMEMVVGSHRGPLYTPRATIPVAWHERIVPEAGGEIPDVAADPARFPCRGFETRRGDVVLFHPTMLHSVPGASRRRQRRTFTIRFLGDDVRWKWRDIVLQDRLRELDLQQGDRPIARCLPRLWPNPE